VPPVAPPVPPVAPPVPPVAAEPPLPPVAPLPVEPPVATTAVSTVAPPDPPPPFPRVGTTATAGRCPLIGVATAGQGANGCAYEAAVPRRRRCVNELVMLPSFLWLHGSLFGLLPTEDMLGTVGRVFDAHEGSARTTLHVISKKRM
jgi:hypothetical protein